MKNHHYIPRCYLKWFTDPNPAHRYEPVIWQGELNSGRVRPRPTRKVASAPGYYALQGDSPEQVEQAEAIFSMVECAAAPVLRKINTGTLKLEEEEWGDLMFFLATLAIRGPSMRSVVEDIRLRALNMMININVNLPLEQFKKSLERAHPGREFSDNKACEIQRWAKDPTNYKITIHPSGSIGTTLKSAIDAIFPMFCKMSWTFIRAMERSEFLTSDCPVVWLSPSVVSAGARGHGLAMKDVEVTVPLGRRTALFGGWAPRPPEILADHNIVEMINSRSICKAMVEVLGPGKAIVEWGLGRHTSRLRLKP